MTVLRAVPASNITNPQRRSPRIERAISLAQPRPDGHETVAAVKHPGPLEQPMDAFAQGERGPPSVQKRRQRLIGAPAGQVIAPDEVHGHIDRASRQCHRLDRREVIGVTHVRHDEPALAVALDQRREPRHMRAGWMYHQQPPAGAGPRRATKLSDSDAADLMGAGFDQPLGLLRKRRQRRQRGGHAGPPTAGSSSRLGYNEAAHDPVPRCPTAVRPRRLLPDEVGEAAPGGLHWKVWLKSRPQQFFSPEVRAGVSKILERLRKSPSDLSVAWALLPDGVPKVVAYRVRGASADTLVASYAEALEAKICLAKSLISGKD